MTHVTDVFLYILALSADIVAHHFGFPGRGTTQPAENPHGGCLPGTIGSQETEYFPSLDLERDMVNGRKVPECLDQLFDPDNGLCLLVRCVMFQSGRAKYIFESFQNNCRGIDSLNVAVL